VKKISFFLLTAVKYFVLQTLGETFLIVILLYMGLQYSDMFVGNEPLWEVAIGILGYHAFFKALLYGWIYIPVFVAIVAFKNYTREFYYSVINYTLSLLLPLAILFLRDLTVKEMSSVFIATLLTSIIIMMLARLLEKPSSILPRD
jgi:hypothetical protein